MLNVIKNKKLTMIYSMECQIKIIKWKFIIYGKETMRKDKHGFSNKIKHYIKNISKICWLCFSASKRTQTHITSYKPMTN